MFVTNKGVRISFFDLGEAWRRCNLQTGECKHHACDVFFVYLASFTSSWFNKVEEHILLLFTTAVLQRNSPRRKGIRIVFVFLIQNISARQHAEKIEKENKNGPGTNNTSFPQFRNCPALRHACSAVMYLQLLWTTYNSAIPQLRPFCCVVGDSSHNVHLQWTTYNSPNLSKAATPVYIT